MAKGFQFAAHVALPAMLSVCASAQTAPAPLVIPAFSFPESIPVRQMLPKPVGNRIPQLNHATAYTFYSAYRPENDLHLGDLHVQGFACVYTDGGVVSIQDVPEHSTPARRQPCQGNIGINTVVGVYGMNSSATPVQPGLGGAHEKFPLEVFVENDPVSTVPLATPIYQAPATYLTARWNTYILDFKNPSSFKFHKAACIGPCFYRATITLDHAAATSLDTSELGHGEIWINGQSAGHYANGKRLSIPPGLLHDGSNEIIAFDMQGDPFARLGTVIPAEKVLKNQADQPRYHRKKAE